MHEIEEKLKAAEERRQQLESMKIAALSAQMQKIEDASRKKDEQTHQFILATREALEQKMEQHGSNREAYITDLKTKLKVVRGGKSISHRKIQFYLSTGSY